MGDNGAMIFVDGKLLEEKVAPFLKDQPSSADFLAGLHSIRNEKLGGLLPGVTWTPSPDKHVNLCVVPVKLTNGKLLSHDEAESFVCPPQWKPE
jgi:hypothetical protein